MKKIVFVCLLLTMLYSCSKENPVENPIISRSQNTDLINREPAPGVRLWVDSLKDEYSLDESLKAEVFLKNFNNNGFRILIDGTSQISWLVFNSSREMVCQWPLFTNFEESYYDTLWPGENLQDNINWPFFPYDPDKMYNSLKLFSGQYTMEIYYKGLEDTISPDIVKHFKINETGDPLGWDIFENYNLTDSIEFSFVLRNRINKPVTLTASVPWVVYITESRYKENPDTLFKINALSGKSSYILPPHSDNMMCKFRYAKKDLADAGITGGLEVLFDLYFKERKISAMESLYILK